MSRIVELNQKETAIIFGGINPGLVAQLIPVILGVYLTACETLKVNKINNSFTRKLCPFTDFNDKCRPDKYIRC
ncbi:hypothetical protein GAMM_70008 [Gammaproteobacteria bacterium]